MNDAACPADEALMPLLAGGPVDSAVQSHVSDCPTCRRRLDLFGSDLAGLRATPTPAAPFTPPTWPTLIGKYRVLGPISANVFRAVDPMRLTELAVRLMPRTAPQDGSRLAADARRLTAADAPTLARVCDVGEYQGRPFVATEFVRGPTLRELVGASGVSPRLAADLVARIAIGVDEAHRQGVVHLNISPDTIRVDPAGHPRLLDLGTPRAVAPVVPTAPPGGPTFRAPEQAAGGGQYVGPRTDVFGLGAVLHFLLTGHPPFAPEAAAAAKGIPDRIRLICAKALSPRPDDRYPTAIAMARELAGNQSEAAARQRKTRRRAMTIAAALSFLVVVGALSFIKPKPPGETAPLTMLVTRNGVSAPLAAAGPLAPETDRIQIMARIPAGHTGVIFRVDPAGTVHTLETTARPADGETHVVYPDNGDPTAFPAGPSGTEVVLACAAEDATRLDGLSVKIGELLNGLPVLPAAAVVELSPDGVKHEPPTDDPPAEVSGVELRLERLRDALADRQLSVVRGLAYAR